MRNASQGVGFHRVKRLRKQKHSSTALTLSALFHTGKHEKQAVHQLLFGLHMQCIMSVFFRLFRLKGGSGTKTNSSDVRPFPHVEFNLSEFNSFSKNIKLFSNSSKTSCSFQENAKRSAASENVGLLLKNSKTLL